MELDSTPIPFFGFYLPLKVSSLKRATVSTEYPFSRRGNGHKRGEKCFSPGKNFLYRALQDGYLIKYKKYRISPLASAWLRVGVCTPM